MNLQDYIRNSTQEITDVLKQIEEKKLKFIGERRAAEERIKRLGTQISEQHEEKQQKRRDVQEREKRLEAINREIDDLEKKRGLLIEELNSVQNFITDSKGFFLQVERLENSSQRDINDEKNGIRKIDGQIEMLDAERARHEIRSREAYLAAFKLFLKDVNSTLAQSYGNISSKRANIEALSRLKRSRHEDGHVSNLCDARDEWKRILKTAGVPAVIEAANNELKIIEAELERMFPGALQLEVAKSNGNHITELYYYAVEEETVVFMPFGHQAWSYGNEGAVDQELFFYFVWWFAKKLNLSFDSVLFRLENDIVLLVSEKGMGDLNGKNDIKFTVSGEESMTFILSQIPYDVLKSIKHEDIAN